MSPAEMMDEVNKFMALGLSMLERCDPKDENDIVTPTIVVYTASAMDLEDKPKANVYAMFVDHDEGFETIEKIGLKHGSSDDDVERTVVGVVHLSEGWASSTTSPEPPKIQPRDDPNRKEVVMVVGATMAGWLVASRLVYDRDPETRKPIVDRTKITTDTQFVQPPKAIRRFMHGYIKGLEKFK